ncbi:MAG: ABC transporter ATP-binding protein [Dehalococcoidales bacterium]|nr:ABC transporter ATP-binding protein [Dehalococcoidales bacterium]
MLEVRNLTRIYRMGNVAVNALLDVSFNVPEGHITCITGKSGSGKSTLLRQLGLLDHPTRGQILLNNQEVTGLSDGARSRLRLNYLGYVFQEFALLQELTAHENVYLPAMMLGGNNDYHRRAGELLDQVGLKARWQHLPKELSGGEQQRVAIARALINRPRILFADEPCANLDSGSSQMIMETMVKLNSDMGLTIVFVSHDSDDKKYATNWLTLSDGKLIGRSNGGAR